MSKKTAENLAFEIESNDANINNDDASPIDIQIDNNEESKPESPRMELEDLNANNNIQTIDYNSTNMNTEMERLHSSPNDEDDNDDPSLNDQLQQNTENTLNKPGLSAPDILAMQKSRSEELKVSMDLGDLDFTQKSQSDSENDDDDPNFPIFDPLSACYPWETYKKDYIQVKNEILAGIVVAFACIPEAIAFAILAGVPPEEGLQSTWVVGFITSVFGGRTTMISGATGAIGAVLGSVESQRFVYPCLMLSGCLIILCGIFKLTKFARLIPHSAMVGFLNGLAIIIGTSQLHTFHHVHGVELVLMLIMALIVALIVYYLPRYTKVIPSSLAGIVVNVFIEYAIFRAAFGVNTKTIGDLGDLNGGIPTLVWIKYDNIPGFTWDTISTILLPAIWITLVAVSEDIMTIDVVSEMTNTKPETQIEEDNMVRQQIIVMGAANVIGGMLATMGGGSTIGISIISCFQGSNGRYRIAGVTHCLSVFLIVVFGYEAIAAVPASALVGIMGCTVYHTFEWYSLGILIATMLPQTAREYLQKNVYKGTLRKMPRADAAVVVLVTLLTLFTNLGIAIVAGLLFSSLVYSWESAHHLTVEVEYVHLKTEKGKDNSDVDLAGDSGGQKSILTNNKNIMKIYHLEGPLFFGNAKTIISQFTPKKDPDQIEIHLRDANMYDFSAINALNEVAAKYKKLDKSVHLRHVRDQSHKLIAKAHSLVTHFTYDTQATAEDRGKFSLRNPEGFHVAQYPK